MSGGTEEDLSLRSVGRSALILTGGATAVQVVATLRELYVAARVGVSPELDALLIALVLPTTLAGVLTSGTVTALVPAYVEAREARGPQGARLLTGALLIWVGLGGLLLSIALELLSGLAVNVTGPGLSAAGSQSAVGYLHLLAPIAFVSAVTAICYGICQAEERFAAIAWSALAGSFTTFLATVVLWNDLQLEALAVGNLIGPIVTFVVLFGSLVRGRLVPRPTLRLTGLGLGAFAQHAGPLTLSGAILQVNVVADRAVATLIAPGAVSALRYADVLVRAPVGAISPAWGAALYPALVRSAHGAFASGLASATSRSLRYALAVFTPISVLTIAVAPIATAVAFERGAFGQGDVAATAAGVAAFAPLIVILMTQRVLVGALNAQRRGRILLMGGAINVVLNLLLDVIFGFWLGAAGVALSSSVTSAVVLVFFAVRLAGFEPSFELAPIGRTLGLTLLASLPPAAVALIVSWSGITTGSTALGIVALFLIGTVGLLAYFVVGVFLGLEEPRIMLDVALERLRRRRSEARPVR